MAGAAGAGAEGVWVDAAVVVLAAVAFAGGPAVITAVDAAARTRTAVIAITPRCPWIVLGKSPRRPSTSDAMSAQATSSPPAM